MKNFLLLLILFAAPLTAAKPVEKKLDSISYRSQAGATVALITLSDESVWKWTPDIYSENLLRKWTKGDTIIIQVGNHPGFLLENPSTPHYTPLVALSFSSYPLYPTLKKYDKQSSSIELSDGSQWVLLHSFNKRTLHHWAEEDQIIPVKGTHGNYELINLDIPYENRSQIERCIEVVPHKE